MAVENTPETTPTSTLADDLAASWAEVEDTTDDDQTSDSSAEVDTSGSAPAADTDSTGGQPDADDGAAPGAAAAASPAAAEKDGAVAPDTPPNSLSPAAREAWKDLSPVMKKEIAKREKDFEAGIVKYSQDAHRAQQMDAALQPYQQYFAMQGQPVGQTINSLLQTASILQMGSPVQRAQTVAQLIGQFGVDIATLDNLLAGEAPPAGQQGNQELKQLLDQELAPMRQMFGQFQQQQQFQQQSEQQAVTHELTTFKNDPKNEFFNDVAMDMADILDLAHKRGLKLNLPDAYNRACMMHPEISQVLLARQRQPTPGQRAAASTVRGSRGGSELTPEPGSLRESIERAWETAEVR